MPEQYKIDQALMLLRIADYLLVEADKRGMTHGEKHHFIFVALSQLREARFVLNDERYSVLTHNDVSDLQASDIPF